MTKRKRYRQVVEAVMTNDWLMTPEKLSEISLLLERRHAGEVISEDVIRLQFGDVDAEEANTLIDGVQVINVDGVLSPRMNLMTRISGGSSTELLAAEVIQAMENPEVRTILLAIDSPGGAASGVPELAMVVRRAAQQKRVVAVGRNQMASGAYWVGAASVPLFATPSTMVGSIGVYQIVQDASKAAENAGVKYTVVRAGALKAADFPMEAKTEQQMQAIQQRIDSVYRNFVSAVAEYRNLPAQTVASEQFGQGNVFTADEAKDRGMIDGVLLFEDVLQQEIDRASGQRSVTGFSGAPRMKYSDRLRAALFARGLTTGTNVSDEFVDVAIQALSVSGIKYDPEQEDKFISQLMGVKETCVPDAAAVQAPPVVAQPAASPDQIALEERSRITQLQAKGQLLGIDKDVVQAAIDCGKDLSSAVVEWTDLMARTDPAKELSGSVVPGLPQADKFVEQATAALLSRLPGQPNQSQLYRQGGSLRNQRLVSIAQHDLAQRGHRVTWDEHQDALAWLQLGGTEERLIESEFGPMAAGGAANNPSEHPDLLSNLANKVLDRDLPKAQFSYTRWAQQLEDLADFKPRSILATGIWSELDFTGDDDDLLEKMMDSETEAFIFASDYRNGAKLTVTMVVNDDLGGFAQQLAGFPYAGENTLNNTCIKYLVQNINMIDGNPMYQAGNNNLVTTGSVPSASSVSEHRRLHRLQKNRGREGAYVPIDIPPSIALGPAALEEKGKQTLGNYTQVPETDANVNTVRNEVEWITDSFLDEFSDVEWYTFIPPSIHSAIAWANRRGYSMGRRTTWYENGRRLRVVSYERSFGVTAKSRRGVVKNPGE